MHILSHLSYPFLLANIIGWIIGKPVTIEQGLILMLFSVVPDFDYAFDWIKQKMQGKTYKIPAYHHGWPSHWPIVYTPLVALSIITGHPYIIAATAAIYLHLFMDLFFCSTGLMLFYPFSKRWYSILSEKTWRKPGLKWNKVYQRMAIYDVDRAAFAAAIVIISVKGIF